MTNDEKLQVTKKLQMTNDEKWQMTQNDKWRKMTNDEQWQMIKNDKWQFVFLRGECAHCALVLNKVIFLWSFQDVNLQFYHQLM